MRITVLGDCTLDTIVRAAADERLRAGGDVPARIQVGPGGQGSNVAVRLARTGVGVRLVCPLADDAAAYLLRGHLGREGVEVAALPASRTAAVVVMVMSGADRSMLSDRIPVEGDLTDVLAGADWVHVSGYVLREPLESRRVVDGIRASGIAHVSVGGGSYAGSPDASQARHAIEAMAVALLVVNRDEAELLAGGRQQTAAEAARALATAGRLVIVTDGPGGAAAAGLTLHSAISCAPSTVNAVDATGAGDAVAAEVLARLVGPTDATWPPGPKAITAALTAAVAAGGRAAEAMGAQSS